MVSIGGVVLAFGLCALSVIGAPYEENNNEKLRTKRNTCDCSCGVSNRQMRVVGGNITKVNEFPWLAGLSKAGQFLCGASLITKKHVITAAHCVNGFDVRQLSLIFNDHDMTSKNRLSQITVRGIKKVMEHEHFDSYSFNNDIAVLELSEPVDFDKKIQPICLPETGNEDYSGKTALVAGWGRTAEHSKPSHILRKVAIPVWTKKECYNSGYGERKISENMFCAGYPEGKKDACQGDSGGPLHLKTQLGDMELIGLVSWGRGCARPNLPGIYTKVQNYLDWVYDAIEGECLCHKRK